MLFVVLSAAGSCRDGTDLSIGTKTLSVSLRQGRIGDYSLSALKHLHRGQS